MKEERTLMTRMTPSKRVVTVLLIPLLLLSMLPPPVLAQGPSAPSGGPEWPRQFQNGSFTITVYQPQVESWKGRDLSGRAAVSVKDAASPEEQFGVIWFAGKTNVNRAENLVTVED